MSIPSCACLDRYLGNDLSGLEREAFQSHLEGCPQCRQAAEEQERLNQLLLRATTQLNPFPAFLRERVEQRLRSARRRQLLRGIAAFAAVLLVALGLAAWQLTYRYAADISPALPSAGASQPAPPPGHDPRSQVQVTFPPRVEVIAVPLPTASPNVTLIWLYPTEATTMPAPASAPSPLLERNGL
jgi:anti-sigma factor RsiW